jgi:trimethylamine--corrinoid protein Co-methyltransferase
MRFQAQVLSEAEQERIHQSSLRILEEVGVRFHGEKALPLLAKNGAKVDWDEKIARIPPQLVEQCLATMPKAFVLGARNPQYDYPVPSGESRYCIDGTAAFAMDFESGQRRYGVRQDIVNGLRIFQTLELGRMAWAPTCASDMPAPARALAEFFAMAGACSKHGEHELHTAGQVPYLVEGLAAVMGSEAAFKERKCFSLIYCPVAPLSHDGEMLDAYLELGEFEMPVTTMPMPICGTTGPASLFGNLCEANAENLSCVVVYQLHNPGRPIILGSATGIVDFMSGAYLGGVSEMGLMSAGMTAMANYYADGCGYYRRLWSGGRRPAPGAGAAGGRRRDRSMGAPAGSGGRCRPGQGSVRGYQAGRTGRAFLEVEEHAVGAAQRGILHRPLDAARLIRKLGRSRQAEHVPAGAPTGQRNPGRAGDRSAAGGCQ